MTDERNWSDGTGKKGIWMLIFPDWEYTGNLSKILEICFTRVFYLNTGKFLRC